MERSVTAPIRDTTRLAALRRVALLDSPAEPAFDRLTRLAASIIDVPVALVSLVDVDRQFFKSSVGLPEPWDSLRETPLSHSFCQHVVATAQPLIITDARETPLVRDNLAVRDLNVIAYLGFPLTTSDGHTLGSFCVIDGKPRSWTEVEIAMIRDLTASVMTEIELRVEVSIRGALLRVARRFATLEDADQLLGELLGEAIAAVGGDDGGVSRWEPTLNALVQAHSFLPTTNRGSVLGPNSASGRAAATRAPVILNEYQAVVGRSTPAGRSGARALLAVPLMHEGSVLGALSIHSLSPQKRFTNDDATVLEILASLATALLVKIEHSRAMQQHAEEDPLTGLANRRKMLDALSRYQTLADRHHLPLSLAVLDLDHFKAVNDRHGHTFGDVVLRRVSELLQQSFRGEDVVGRWGGEEFIIGMYGCSKNDAVQRLEATLARLSALPFPDADESRPLSMTFSAGVVEYPTDGVNLDTLFRDADTLLYQAKAAGRARVLVTTKAPDAALATTTPIAVR